MVPGSQRNDTPSTASWEPYRLLRSVTSIMATAWRRRGDGVYPPPGEAGQTLVGAGDRLRSLVGRAARDPTLDPMLPEVARPGGRLPPPALAPRLDRRHRLLPARAAGRRARAGRASTSTRTCRRPLVPLDLVAGLIGCCLLWLRRRWPVHVAVVLALIAAFSALRVRRRRDRAVHRRRAPRASRSSLAVDAPSASRCCRSTSSTAPRGADPLWVVGGVLAIVTAASSRGACSCARGASSCCRCASAPSAPRPSSSCASSRRASRSARGSRARCTTCSPTGSRC